MSAQSIRFATNNRGPGSRCCPLTGRYQSQRRPTSLPNQIPSLRLSIGQYQQNCRRAKPRSRTQITLIRHETHQDRYQIVSDVQVDLELLTTYFPGWQATLGDQSRCSIEPNAQSGLIQIQVPPTNSELIISFGSTPTRQSAWFLTWSALALLLFLTRWRTRHPIGTTARGRPALGDADRACLAVVLAAFTLIAIVFTNPASPLTLYNSPGHALARSNRLASTEPQ